MLSTAKNYQDYQAINTVERLKYDSNNRNKGRHSYKASGIYKSWAMIIIYSKAHWSLVIFS